MFDPQLIPSSNKDMEQLFAKIMASSKTGAQVQKVAQTMIQRANNRFSDAIIKAPTVSEYLANLWSSKQIYHAQRQYIANKLEEYHQTNANQILAGKVSISSRELDIESEILPAMKIDDYQKQVFEKKEREFFKVLDKDDAEKYLKPESFEPGFHDVMKYVSRPLISTKNGEMREIKKFHFSTAGLLMQDPTDQFEHERLEQAEKLVKDLHVKKKEYESKIREIEDKEAERTRSELERVKVQEEREEEERSRRKKIEKLDNIKRIQMRREERVRNKTLWEEELKKYQQREPLYIQFEKKYKEEVELPAIKHHKQVLKEIHEFHRPLDREKLLQHERRVIARDEELKLKQKRLTSHQSNLSFDLMSDRRFQEYFNVRHSHDRAIEAQKETRKKILEYVATIKKPSPKRKTEHELLRITSNTSANSKYQRSFTIEERSRDEIHSEILSSVSRGPGNLISANHIHRRHRTVEKKNILNDEPKEEGVNKAERKYPNYLGDIKKKYNLQIQKDKWKDILNRTELDPSTRRKQILIETNRLEEKAGMKELLLKTTTRNNTSINRYVEGSEEVDSILLNSIEAKLSLLSEEVNALDQPNATPGSKKQVKNSKGQHSKVNKSMDAGTRRFNHN